MGGGRVNQMWALGGAPVAAALLAIAWFLFIGPRNSEASSLRDQASTARDQLAPQRQRLAQLRQQNGRLDEYKAELARNREAVPTTPAMPEFLRSLQTAGEATSVGVNGVAVGIAEKVTAAGKQLTALPVTLTADGTPDNLNRLLDQIQQVQSRAVLVNATDLEKSSDGTGNLFTMTIKLDVFVDTAS
jgi:Tfp pilus assembly protein PilO